MTVPNRTASSGEQPAPWIACGELEGYEFSIVGNRAGLETLAAAVSLALSDGSAELGLPRGRISSVMRVDRAREELSARRYIEEPARAGATH